MITGMVAIRSCTCDTRIAASSQAPDRCRRTVPPQDKQEHHNSALFVQWVPYSIDGSSWEAEESRYVEHLLSICDR